MKHLAIQFSDSLKHSFCSRYSRVTIFIQVSIIFIRETKIDNDITYVNTQCPILYYCCHIYYKLYFNKLLFTNSTKSFSAYFVLYHHTTSSQKPIKNI